MLAMTFVACDDEIVNPTEESKQPVDFSTILGPSTRGATFTKTELEKSENGFSVSAYNQEEQLTWTSYLSSTEGGKEAGKLPAPSDEMFMHNTKVTFSTTSWTYSPEKYWPGKVDGENYGRVTFFALGGLAKEANTITYNATTNAPEFTYTTAAAAADQKDLVADVLFDECWEKDKQVKFQFNHILSRIGFSAVLHEDLHDGTKVFVTNLRVDYADDKVANAGTYAFDLSGTNGITAAGTWTPNTASFLSGSSGELVGSNVTVEDTEIRINDNDKFLMLIPQTTTALGALTVHLMYKIETQDDSEDDTVEYPLTYKLPATLYGLGKQYTYKFILTLNPVVFDVHTTIGEWEIPGSQPGEIDL